MIKKSVMAGLVMSLFATVGAYAQEKLSRESGQKRDPEAFFKKMDADGDSKLSKAEVEKIDNDRMKLKENFAVIDTNKDSFLDKEELKAYRNSKKKDKNKG